MKPEVVQKLAAKAAAKSAAREEAKSERKNADKGVTAKALDARLRIVEKLLGLIEKE